MEGDRLSTAATVEERRNGLRTMRLPDLTDNLQEMLLHCYIINTALKTVTVFDNSF